MTEIADELRPEPPKPPHPGLLVAVFLESAMVGTWCTLLPNRRAVMGLLLCLCYFYFSASLAYLERLWKSPP